MKIKRVKPLFGLEGWRPDGNAIGSLCALNARRRYRPTVAAGMCNHSASRIN